MDLTPEQSSSIKFATDPFWRKADQRWQGRRGARS